MLVIPISVFPNAEQICDCFKRVLRLVREDVFEGRCDGMKFWIVKSLNRTQKYQTKLSR